ncbi:hypothetical protein JKP22_01735 [Vibrio vulnificus]|uniref:hypothetical protein n=1 Tax=Vibrio vulnificus TaxID=672 RepID=UPI001CDBBE51|nr:hypothetical protein [Vibrio vulnificus]MCA4011492.1 hypothetical protein [Vibrio vulnificus]
MSNDNTKDIHWSLLWNARLGIRYHTYRQSTYERLGKLITLFTLISSSGAFAIFIKSTDEISKYSAVLTLTAAILQLIELVFDTKARSILHSELKQKYLRLERDLVCIDSLTLEQASPFYDQRVSIEEQEPPVYKSLMTLCHNDLVTVTFGHKHSDKIKINAFTWMKIKLLSLSL